MSMRQVPVVAMGESASLPELRSMPSLTWQRARWILAGLIAGLVISGILGMRLPQVFQSTAQISVIKKRPDAVTGVDTRQMSAEDYLPPPQDLLKSPIIIDGAIRSQELAALPSLSQPNQEPADIIRNSLSVTQARGPAGQSPVLKLQYRAGDPADCRAVLAAILDSYQDFIVKKHQSVSQDTLELILREKQALEQDMSAKEQAYLSFRDRAPLISKNKDGTDLRQERLMSIQTKRSATLLQKVEVEGQVAAVETALKEGRSPETILAMISEFARKNEPGDQGREKQMNLQEQLMPLLMEERNLLKTLGPKHPDVLAIRERIEVARRLVLLPARTWKGALNDVVLVGTQPADDPIASHLQLLKQKLNHLKLSEEMLANVFQSEQDEARKFAAVELQHETYRTNLAHQQQLYEALVKRLNEVNLMKQVGGYQVEMIEPPSLGRRVSLSLVVILGLGGFLGIVGGFVLSLWVTASPASRVP